MFSSLDRFHPFGVLVMRLVLGVIMVVHGSMKIFPRGSLYNFVHFVHSLGLPVWSGYLAAFTELFGGAMIIIGLLTPIAAFAIAIDMAVAILKVHLHHGLTGPQGYEFPLACFALAVGLTFAGHGHLAVDQRFGGGRSVRLR
jgi:putative oxidoreductase